jgi:hypothetical protein
MNRAISRQTGRRASLLILSGCLILAARLDAEPAPIRALFLGDGGHHRPADRFQDLEPVLAGRGIQLTYTDKTSDLAPETLARYDCLIVYANTTRIAPEEEKALLDYVASGNGFVPIHCASYCFLNSPAYIDLVGAQFLRHGTGVFRTAIAEPEHPVMRGFHGFESWDETYVHHKHNDKDRVILERRNDDSGSEPWTWVRTHEKGRIFYTAWGHDERTWGHPGFQNLIERGIRWATGSDPAAALPYRDAPELARRREDVKPFEFREAKVPYYPPGERWGTVGEPFSKMQVPLDPAESIKHAVTPVGFEVKLFAAEPDIVKPICMSWDEAGRLWIAETVDYPNEFQPPGQGHDRIKICEDTDGDGRADRFKVFADTLSLPTSIAFANGGIVVHQPPQTLFLRDTDGDDAADERRVLFSGWSTADTHAGPSNLVYGHDNWLWGIVGYSGFEGEIGGERHSFRQGFYRFRPDGSKMEFLRNTNNNSWGVSFSEEGVCFGSTANGNPSVHLPIPSRYYEAVRGWSTSVLRGIAGNPKMHTLTDKVRQVDYHGNFTAAAGHALYTARSYPREFWNRTAFVCEPTGHIVAAFTIDPAGASYRSRHSWSLLSSDDEWTAPIMAEVGPDGQVWVIDWYNFIVQHNPTPAGFRTGRGAAYVTDLRDKTHGRILRIVHTAAAAASRPGSLKGASPEELVAALKRDNLFWRRHAQRLLVERGKKDVVPALIDLVKDEGADAIGINPGAIHALWTLHGLGALDGSDAAAIAAAKQALRHRSAGVRRSAIMVLPRQTSSTAALMDAGLLRDADPQVRLAALLALAEGAPSEEAAAALVAALGEPRIARDRWLLDALTAAAAANDLSFLKNMVARRPQGADERELAGIVERVAEHYARGSPAATLGSLLESLSSAPGAAPLKGALVAGLARGWPSEARVSLEPAAAKALVQLFEALPPESRGQLVSLAARWGSESLKEHAGAIAKSFLAQVRDENASDRARVEAAARLVELSRSDAELAAELLDLAGAKATPDLARGILDAVARSDAPATGEAIVERLGSMTPALRAAALRALLARAQWTRGLLQAIEAGDVQIAELSLDQKQALAEHPDRGIAEEAKKLLARESGLPSPDREQVLAELLPLAERRGDAARGKAVFQKQCSKCHVHSGEGQSIGPDLSGMAVHPKTELLTQIIDPNRSVEGNFRVYTAVTKEGRIITGLLSSESRTALELVDVEAQRHVVQREDLTTLVASPKSLMPEGFEKQVSAEEIADLLEFLGQRGKYLPLPLQKAATAVSTRGLFNSEEARGERMAFQDWTPKTFAEVPFHLVDPQDGRIPNVILLYGPQGQIPPRMPKSVRVPCNAPAKAIHLLSGVSGWGFPLGEKGSVTMIVRLHYADGTSEDHRLLNGEHFADYIRREDVPGSQFAFSLRGRQIRYLSLKPRKQDIIREVEFAKGTDDTAPLVMAATVEIE